MRKIALILLIVLLVGVAYLEAQTTGRIAVRVRDSQGRPLEFVNIVVMRGTQRISGGQTDEKGQAIIINIPPGTYTVKLTLVSYAPNTFQDVISYHEYARYPNGDICCSSNSGCGGKRPYRILASD